MLEEYLPLVIHPKIAPSLHRTVVGLLEIETRRTVTYDGHRKYLESLGDMPAPVRSLTLGEAWQIVSSADCGVQGGGIANLCDHLDHYIPKDVLRYLPGMESKREYETLAKAAAYQMTVQRGNDGRFKDGTQWQWIDLNLCLFWDGPSRKKGDKGGYTFRVCINNPELHEEFLSGFTQIGKGEYSFGEVIRLAQGADIALLGKEINGRLPMHRPDIKLNPSEPITFARYNSTGPLAFVFDGEWYETKLSQPERAVSRVFIDLTFIPPKRMGETLELIAKTLTLKRHRNKADASVPKAAPQ